jgi:hypothetical protein
MSIERKPFFLVLLACAILCAGQVDAHASEQGLVLLLPTGAYAAAGTLTVVASILLVTCLPKNILNLLFQSISLGRVGVNKPLPLSMFTSLSATVLFLLLVFIGFRGPTDPQNNLLPLTIWTVWWIGVFVVQGVVFDVWKWVNPWTGFVGVLDLGKNPILRISKKLGVWPAVILLVCFQLFLLADISPSDPQRLATIVFGYWVFTLVGIELCGKDTWLQQVECFSVLFRLIGSLRSFQHGGFLRLGLPGWYALKHAPLSLSQASFCLIILTGGSFDGVNETFWWLAQLGINPLEFPGRSAVIWSSTFGLFAAIVFLFTIYGASIWVGLKAIEIRGSSDRITYLHAFNMFAVTLLPIALGYHFAHYLVSFMVQIKFTLSTASDPMALGWNLFGLGAIKATTGFLGVPETVKTIWLTQAGVVVVSHIVSVLMGHNIATQLCRNNKDVVLIQIGLIVLMIAYTMFGLWLLASPRGA